MGFPGQPHERNAKWSGHSVNYVCFLHDFFHSVPIKVWPGKRVILQRLSPAYERIAARTRRRAFQRFRGWWGASHQLSPESPLVKLSDHFT